MSLILGLLIAKKMKVYIKNCQRMKKQHFNCQDCDWTNGGAARMTGVIKEK